MKRLIFVRTLPVSFVSYLNTITCLAVCLAAVALAPAQEESATARIDSAPTVDASATALSIESAVAEAIGNHPDLQSAAAEIRRQQHLVYQSTRKPNPTVGYSASEVGNDGQAGQQGVFLSQNIIRGSKLELNGRIGQRDVSVAHHELNLRRQQVAADSSLAFLNVAVAQERQKLLERLQTSLNQAESSARRLLNSGIISLSSLSQAKLETQKNVMQIQQTNTELSISKSRLGTLIGRPSLTDVVAAVALLPNDELPDLELVWNSIVAESPELALASCRYDQSHWKVRREVAEPIPDLQTQWSVQQDASTNYAVLGIQIGVELPIRDTNSGAISAARADTWRTHHDVESIRRSLRQRLVLTHGQMQQASQQLKFIREELEALARVNLQKTQQAFSLGDATYLDLLNAQRTYIGLSLDVLNLYQQRAVANVHLETFLVRASLTE